MLWQLESSKVKSEAECYSDRNTSEFTITIYYSEVFRSRRILIPSAFTAKIQSIKVEKQQTLTFPVRILLGYAEVINSARILDGISVRSPVRKAADTLCKKLLFQLCFFFKKSR